MKPFPNLAAATEIILDIETTGPDWRRDKPVGYVVTWGPAPEETGYWPTAHASGNEHPDQVRAWVRDTVGRPGLRVSGHNLIFDLHMAGRDGIEIAGPVECTMVNMALIDEHRYQYNLEAVAQYYGAPAKQVDIYDYIAEKLGVKPESDKPAARRKLIGHFWKLDGQDPHAQGYAAGDGTSTWHVKAQQQRDLDNDELRTVWDVECRLVRVLFKMEQRGVRVDMDRLATVKVQLQKMLEDARRTMRSDFKALSHKHVEEFLRAEGVDFRDAPATASGGPSFVEAWLETTEPGARVLLVRRIENLFSSFIDPMESEHLVGDRIHTDFNQLKQDDYGTISGRLSSSKPNMQQVPKRNKLLAKLFRSVFLPEVDHRWGSCDYSQCFAAGTKISVPSGTKNIEEIKSGDWVYSFNRQRRLVLRKVSHAACTGTRSLYRVHWRTFKGRRGHVDTTVNHRFRKINGEYISVAEMLANQQKTGRLSVSLLALRRDTTMHGSIRRSEVYLHATGHDRLKESRFVFEQVYRRFPEQVHHADGDQTNNDPNNLIGATAKTHTQHHRKRPDLTSAVIARAYQQYGSLTATARALQCSRSTITHHLKNHIVYRVEELGVIEPVYDIQVDGSHNFIANEVCAHNCEFRIFADYSEAAVLIDGYNATPPVDIHSYIASMLSVERDPTAKRINLGMLYGMGKGKLARSLKISDGLATIYRNEYDRFLPEARSFLKSAEFWARKRGWVRTKLKRRARFPDLNLCHKAGSRIIQGTNADIIKLKNVEVAEMLIAERAQSAPTLTVHDELTFTIHREEQHLFKRCIEVMQDFSEGQPIHFKIPITVDANLGDNWSEATFPERKRESEARPAWQETV